MNVSITWVFSRSEKGRHSYAPGGRLMRSCQFSKRQWDFLKQPRELSQPTMMIRSFAGIAVCGFCKAELVPNGVRKWKSLTPAKARRFNSLILTLKNMGCPNSLKALQPFKDSSVAPSSLWDCVSYAITCQVESQLSLSKVQISTYPSHIC